MSKMFVELFYKYFVIRPGYKILSFLSVDTSVRLSVLYEMEETLDFSVVIQDRGLVLVFGKIPPMYKHFMLKKNFL